MHNDGLACYIDALIANPTVAALTVLVLFGGYLMFGLEPSESPPGAARAR
ncbi:MAG: hypothetical protein R3E83_15920 [Burkholderiaceae bacterium]